MDLLFRNKNELERWLKDKPISWSHVISVRASLRVIPLIGSKADDVSEISLLSVFRANLVSSIAIKLRREDVEKAALSAATAALAAATLTAKASNADSVNAAATATAANAAFAVATSTPNAAFTAATTVATAATAANAVWAAVSADARWLMNNTGSPSELIQQFLWLVDTGAPDWFNKMWKEFRNSYLINKSNFSTWVEWYEGLAPLGSHLLATDVFGAEISRRIALQEDQWWKRGAKEVNADIARWLAEERAKTPPTDGLPEQVEQALSNLSPQEPTAYLYTPENGRVVARSILADPTDPDGAQAYLDNLRDEATALAADLLSKHNYFDSDWIVGSVTKLRDYLWEGSEPRLLDRLNPHLLHSRLRPVKEIADGYRLPPDVEAAYREFKPRIRDVAGAGEDLELCLSPLRRLEAERIARALPEDPAGQEATRQHLTDFVTAIQAVDPAVVDDSAKVALEAEKALADEPASPTERRNRLADSLLNACNLGKTIVKLAGEVLLRKMKSIEAGIDDGLKVSSKYIIIIGGIVFVVGTLSSSLVALANTPGFASLLEAVKALKPLLDVMK